MGHKLTFSFLFIIFFFHFQATEILLHFTDHVNELKVTVILLSALIFIPMLMVTLGRAAQLFKM